MSERLEQIATALASVYTRDGVVKPGGMIEACAIFIDRRWDEWAESERYDGRPYEVHMCIWNWFPGGGTAEIAAQRVLAAVSEGQPT